MALRKDNAMLIDIQYVRENKQQNLPDYCYMIWKDLDSGEKHLEAIKNPPINVYFTKPEYRNYDYNKTEESKDHLYKRTIRYKDVLYAVAEEDGPEAQNFMNQCFQTHNYADLEKIKMSRYAFGHDYDIRVLYRNLWMDHYDNDRPKPIHKAFGDIEVDSMEAKGLPDPRKCPIDLVTIIDGKTKHVYTFCLTGVKFKEPKIKDTTTPEELDEIRKKREMYAHREKEQEYWMAHQEELIQEAHKKFDESYPEFEYSVYFYDDERKMLTHIFQLIHQKKPDFMLFWNISFDIPYIMERMRALGMDPKEVIPHPDFPNKQCHFKKDKLHFAIKNKTDFFNVSDYTVYVDQMINYAAIRKGASELRSNRLTYIAKQEIGDEKLDYSDDGTIKTLSYRNWLLYYLYNIKDVLLQYGIEESTSDIETYYVYSYENITQYENVFKQTVKLRNLQYRSWDEQGLVPGANINAFLYNEDEADDEEEDDDDVEEKKKKKDVNYEGALVGNPLLIKNFGIILYNKRVNNIFLYSIDMDMSAFYPNTVGAMNIYPPCLIFKMILMANQYNVRGGTIPFNGITDVQVVKENDNSFVGDVAKECIDNFLTRNYVSFAHKWMNFPSISQVYQRLKVNMG